MRMSGHYRPVSAAMLDWKTALGDAVQEVFFVSELCNCVERLDQQTGAGMRTNIPFETDFYLFFPPTW